MRTRRRKEPRRPVGTHKAKILPSRQPIPTWLEGPTSSIVPDPVCTRSQELPLDKLAWENFERLCLRLARLNAQVEHCQLYGKRGEKQHGIDLFVRNQDSDLYTVYQCKHVKKFGSSAIKKAVTEFLTGKWVDSTASFVLCTTSSGNRVRCADEFERQNKRLKRRGVSLRVWNLEEISSKLKDHPDIVDDFFGRSWTASFCGSEAITPMANRLDAKQIVRFRRELGGFYQYVFNLHDPGIPIPPKAGIPVVPLVKRYVLPDVYAEETSSAVPLNQTRDQPGVSSEDYEQLVPGTRASQLAASAGQKKTSFQPASQRAYRRRLPVGLWLARSRQSIVLGVPGSGKSSILRYIALDLLSESPTLVAVGTQWASLLPVWVPFAFWTKLIAASPGQQCSLSDCLRQWFGHWDQPHLWSLIEAAMKDERLLLLVDGLDEWTNEDAGRIAAQILQVFVETKNVVVVVTSRPYGFRRIPIHGEKWQVGELAGLSASQREELCSKWFTIKQELDAGQHQQSPSVQAQRPGRETEQFLRELSRSGDLQELSEVPLLLLLLIYLRLQRAVLPRKRFDAYERLIEHLVCEHPAAKRAAAFLTDPTGGLTEIEVRNVLANLAFVVHETHPDAVVSETEVASVVESFLTDSDLGLGLGMADAKRYVSQFAHIAEGTLGLLVRQGVRELSFFHRSFQEFLAATHLSRVSIEQLENLLGRYCTDPRWREVILGVLWRTSRPEDLKRIVARIENAVDDSAGGLIARELLAEVAFGEFNCTAYEAKRLASETFCQIERHPWLPHRKRLLRYALEGMRSTRLRDLVREKVRRWVYARTGWRRSWYEAMKSWPATQEVTVALLTALHDEDHQVQRAAARTLPIVASGDNEVGQELASMAIRALDPFQRAVALDALTRGWPKHERLETALSLARQSESPELRFAAIAARVLLRLHKDGDLKELMELASGQFGSKLGYAWSEDIATTLVSGWKGNTNLKAACLYSVQQPFYHGRYISQDVSLPVVLSGFPQDPEIAAYCAKEIRTGDHPFLSLHHGAWQLISEHFRNYPEVVAAIDEWVDRQEYRDPEVALAAMTGRTPVVKQKLLTNLQKSSVPHWPAGSLLEGWGMEDPEVAAALMTVASGPANRASRIALHISQIIPDAKQARKRLLELVDDPESLRFDFVLMGLAGLREKGDEDEIVERCLRRLETESSRFDQGAESQLIQAFPRVPAVRELAKRALTKREPPVASVAIAFPYDEELRMLVLELVTPLHTSLRAQIVSELSSSPDDSGFPLKILSNYDTESDDDVKSLASIGYCRQLNEQAIEVRDAVQQLAKTVCAYGFDYENRRRAAFAGLLILNRLDVLQNTVETIGGKERVVSIPIGQYHTVNLPLVRLVARNWKKLKSAFGSDFVNRLTGDLHESTAFWLNVCAVAADFPETHGDVLEAIKTDPEVAQHPAALNFLASVKPRSSLLLDRCLSEVARDESTWGGFVRQEAAATILAEHFGGDVDVQNKVLAIKPISLYSSGVILALCAGWPDSPVIDRLYEEMQQAGRPRIDYSTGCGLIFSRINPSKLPEALLSQFENVDFSNKYTADALVNAIVRRLRRDEEAYDMLLKSLTHDLYPNGKATIPRLLAAARGIPQRLAQWSEEELSHQFLLESPQLGMDLLTGGVRSVATCILDVLHASR